MTSDTTKNITVLKALADPTASYVEDITLYDGCEPTVAPLGVRVSVDTRLESVELTIAAFEQPDGAVDWELAVGMGFETREGHVAVVDLLKMAFQHCPELVERALRESGTVAAMRSIVNSAELDNSGAAYS